MATSPKTTRTLDVKPNMGEMVKPVELIEFRGASKLTLHDRRLYNILLHHAFGPDLATENRRFEIALSDLKDGHESNDRLVQSIEALMRTVVTIRRGNGRTERVQLLGWNDISDPDRTRGTLRYSMPPELAVLLRDSTVFAKLEIEVMRNFTSKYALALYEAVSRRVRLRHVMTELFDLSDFRELLGVEVGKLEGYGNLNKFAVSPAVMEVNALAEFTVSVHPQKTGKRITGILVGWAMKDENGRRAAWAELQRPKVGRRARISGTVEPWAPDEPPAY